MFNVRLTIYSVPAPLQALATLFPSQSVGGSSYQRVHNSLMYLGLENKSVARRCHPGHGTSNSYLRTDFPHIPTLPRARDSISDSSPLLHNLSTNHLPPNSQCHLSLHLATLAEDRPRGVAGPRVVLQLPMEAMTLLAPNHTGRIVVPLPLTRYPPLILYTNATHV